MKWDAEKTDSNIPQRRKGSPDCGEEHPEATDELQIHRSTSLDGGRSENCRRIFIRQNGTGGEFIDMTIIIT